MQASGVPEGPPAQEYTLRYSCAPLNRAMVFQNHGLRNPLLLRLIAELTCSRLRSSGRFDVNNSCCICLCRWLGTYLKVRRRARAT